VDFAAEPFRSRIGIYLRWSLALSLLFLLTYGSTNWLASTRATRFHLYFTWELTIPFVPWMVWVYLSLPLFLAMPLWALNSDGINRLGRAFVLATLYAALIHLAFPADPGWPRPTTVPGYPIFERIYSLDRMHNLAPSLHIAYSTLAVLAIWHGTRRTPMRPISAVWFALLVSSVALIHQHHLLDIASGLTLAVVCRRRK
jgi:hypothetical protein